MHPQKRPHLRMQVRIILHWPVVNRFGAASRFLTQFLQHFRSLAVSICMRLPQQSYSLRSIFIDTFSLYIANSEEVLGISIALISRELEPLESF